MRLKRWAVWQILPGGLAVCMKLCWTSWGASVYASGRSVTVGDRRHVPLIRPARKGERVGLVGIAPSKSDGWYQW